MLYHCVSGNASPVQSVTFTSLYSTGYRIVGTHSGVKLCRWTKSMLRGRGGCYKHTFYGIESHRCMETTPSLACANKCVFCWRYEHSWHRDALFFLCVEIWLPNTVVYSICSNIWEGLLSLGLHSRWYLLFTQHDFCYIWGCSLFPTPFLLLLPPLSLPSFSLPTFLPPHLPSSLPSSLSSPSPGTTLTPWGQSGVGKWTTLRLSCKEH